MNLIRFLLKLSAALGLLAATMTARTLSVGPGRPFTTPCQAVAQAVAGDVIEIDAGVYRGDVCRIPQDNVTLRGVGGRARLEAAGENAMGKGIWVVTGDGTVIENIEFTGAAVPDGNGAGIRLDSGNLTVRNCYFHHNENGILGGSRGELLVENSEFAYNGIGDGYTHNIYIGEGITRFTMRYSYSHNVSIGHLVKSRAQSNYILYNRLTEEGGTGSYELDLPNGGLAYVVGNIFQQDAATDNPALLAFGLEGLSPSVPVHRLHAVNNTMVNQRQAGGTFFLIGGGLPPVLRNNILAGPAEITNLAGAQLAGNVVGGMDMGFVNPAAHDYRITALSPALNAGVAPGAASDGFDLRPAFEYRHPLCSAPRADVGLIDAGAYEFGNTSAGQNCGAAPGLERFADVSPDDPFRSAIELMRAKGITNGCTAVPLNYCPLDNVTRGQMAVFLVRSVLGGDSFTSSATPYFQDVPPGHPFFRWIQKLWELGITSGCGAGAYCPEAEVSRGQMAAFIIRARFGPTQTFQFPASAYFSDAPKGHPFFNYIQEMRETGITSGCTATLYCADSPVTRGQMAVFVMRGLFNQLLPETTPILTSVAPSAVSVGQTVDVVITARGTNFQQSVTTLKAGTGITVTQVVVVNPTTLTAIFSVGGNAAAGPRSLTATTGTEEATLPNALRVQ